MKPDDHGLFVISITEPKPFWIAKYVLNDFNYLSGERFFTSPAAPVNISSREGTIPWQKKNI